MTGVASDGKAKLTTTGTSRVRISDVLVEAWSATSYRPVRSLLTSLGTVAGTAALVATIGLTATASAQISDRFDAFKATEVQLRDNQPQLSSTADDGAFPVDAEERLRRLNGVQSSGVYWDIIPTPLVRTALSLNRRDARPEELGTQVLAASPGIFSVANAEIIGRVYDGGHVERDSRVAVVGTNTARTLGLSRVDNQTAIFIDGMPFVVIGIVDDLDRFPELLSRVVIPTSTARSLWGAPLSPATLLIETDSGAAQLVGSQASVALRPHDPDRIQVVVPPEPESLRRVVDEDTRNLFLGLAGLALVVGMVGIANSSLVSVLERTSEIGLRRALGARRRHIFLQFVVETGLLAATGGLLGTFLGLTATLAVSVVHQWKPTVPVEALAVVPLVGVMSGILAGLQPALHAARVSPAESLRA